MEGPVVGHPGLQILLVVPEVLFCRRRPGRPGPLARPVDPGRHQRRLQDFRGHPGTFIIVQVGRPARTGLNRVARAGKESPGLLETFSHLVTVERPGPQGDLPQAARKRVELVVILVGAQHKNALRGVIDRAGLAQVGGRHASIYIELLHLAVVGSDNVVPIAWQVVRRSLQVGQLAIAIIAADAGETEKEPAAVNSEAPALLEVAVILDR